MSDEKHPGEARTALPPPPTRAPRPVPDPLPPETVRGFWRHPFSFFNFVLGDRGRLVATIARRGPGAGLLALLLLASILMTLPYAVATGFDGGLGGFPPRVLDVATLFVGSLAICFPSLQVFSGYFGLEATVSQNLALALVITTVAALFTFGFFPIVWFLVATMAHAESVTPAHLGRLFLVVSLVAGLIQLIICLAHAREQKLIATSPALYLVWQALYCFICHRMALVLGIL